MVVISPIGKVKREEQKQEKLVKQEEEAEGQG
jgi:hypothetical protein